MGTAGLVQNRAEENTQLPAAADPALVQQMFEQIRSDTGSMDPGMRASLIERAQKLASEAKIARGLPREAAKLAYGSGDRASGDLARGAYQKPPEKAPEEENLGVLGVIDLPGRVGRMGVAKVLADDGTDTSWNSPLVRNKDREWNKMIEDKAPVVHRAAQVVGVPVGGALGAVVGAGIEGYRGAKKASLAAFGQDTPKDQDPELGKIWEATKTGAQMGTDIAEQLPFDPLSYVGAPLRGVAGTLAVTGRAAETAGLSAGRVASLKAATELAMKAPTALERSGGVAKAFADHGVDFAKTFGPTGEMLEAGPLRVGLSHPKLGVDVAQVAGKDFALRKPLAKLLEASPGFNKLSPWNVNRTTAREFRRMARAVQGIDQVGFAKAADSVAKMSKDIPLERQSDLLEHMVSPIIDIVPDAKDAAKYASAVKADKDLSAWSVVSTKRAPGSRDAEHVISNGSDDITIHARSNALPKGFVPPKPNEQAWLDAHQSFYEAVRQRGQARGLDIGVGDNLATGRYAPHQFQTDDLAELRGLFNFQVPKKGPLHSGVTLGRFLEDQRSALGGVQGVKVSVNPAEMMTRQIGRASRKFAQHELRTSVGRAFGTTEAKIRKARGMKPSEPMMNLSLAKDFVDYGDGTLVPRNIHKLVEGTFRTGSLAQLAQGTPLAGVARIFETSRTFFKRNRLARPGFAMINAVGDLGAAVIHGLDNPASVVRADRWWKGTGGAKVGGQTIPGPELRRLMIEHNVIPASASEAAKGSSFARSKAFLTNDARSQPGIDFASEAGALQSQLERSAGIPFKQSTVKTARVLRKGRTLDVPSRSIEAVNELFGHNIRAALFVDGLKKGLTPAAAADRVAKAVMDYADAPAAVKWARIAFPFANFLFRAPGTFARGLAQHPGRAGLFPKTVTAANEPSDYGIPARALERGAGFSAGPIMRRGLESVIGKIPKGQDPYVLTRDFLSESSAPAYNLATRGDLTPYLQSLGPEWRAAVELSQGEDLFTGQKIGNVLEEQGNVGASRGVNKAVGALARYAEPYALPAWSETILNNIASLPEGAPVQRLGFMRPLTPDADQFRELRKAAAYGLTAYMADPTTRAANQLYDPDLRERIEALQGTKRTVKNTKKIARNRRGE